MFPSGYPFLSEDEVLFGRMEAFHRERVAVVASGKAPLNRPDDGLLVVHLIPYVCARSRKRFTGTELKDYSKGLPTLSDYQAQSPYFNLDGLLAYDSQNSARSYFQLFRDGRLEAVLSNILFRSGDSPIPPKQKISAEPGFLRDPVCEIGVIKLVQAYRAFCSRAGLQAPVSLFSALIGCEGAQLRSPHHPYEDVRSGIDRSPAFLPEVEIGSLDAEIMPSLREWCDTLAQALGWEKSRGFDSDGKHQQQR